MARKIASTVKRAALRETLWPGVSARSYPKLREKGWCKLPRTMPLVLQLLGQKELNLGMDLTRAYLGIWSDNYGDGLVEIDDEESYAEVAGFSGQRGVRSWRDRIKRLQALGFLETSMSKSSRVNFVCVIDPHEAVRGLADRGIKAPADWMLQYSMKLILTGAASDDDPAAEEMSDPAEQPNVSELTRQVVRLQQAGRRSVVGLSGKKSSPKKDKDDDDDVPF